MCGITGYLGKNKEENSLVSRRMTEKIIHRGPDDNGFFANDSFGFGMRRLSIIDLARGKQPIASKNGSVIIFNGEIYNYKELRDKFLNYPFHTDSDTETILALYEQEGIGAISKLRGMFTFAIYDPKKEKILLARDFFGIKPLYYATRNGKVVGFASEIKSLLEIPGWNREVNEEAIYQYLSYQYNPLKETFFKNIYKLDPGSILSIDTRTGGYKEESFWQFSFAENKNLGVTAGAELRTILEDSVKHHMISDVPVGAFLSSGVDSSAVVALMQKISGRPVKTFTVGFEGLSEGKDAKPVADKWQTDHKEIYVSKDEYFKALPKATYHFDEPVGDPSAIGIYFLSKEAAKSVKVVLSGEGADELFGGYRIYREALARENFTKFVPSFLRSILKLLTYIPVPFKGKNFLKRYFTPLSRRYIGNASIFNMEEKQKLWRGSRFKEFDLSSLYAKATQVTEPTQMQYIDINTWLVGDILAKADKMTMAHSLELRVPYLDTLVANFAKTVPDSLKFKGGATKFLLREAVRGLIPEKTRERLKLGFPVPIARWIYEERATIRAYLAQNQFFGGYFSKDEVLNLVDSHSAGDNVSARKIYLLYFLSLWHDKYFN